MRLVVEETGSVAVDVFNANHLRRSDQGSGRLASDFGVESVLVVGAVVDDSLVAVGVHHRVLSLNLVASSNLLLRFDVAGRQIADGIVEVVVGVVAVLEVAMRGWDSDELDGGWNELWVGGDEDVSVRADVVASSLLLVADHLLLAAILVLQVADLSLSLLIFVPLVLADAVVVLVDDLLLLLHLTAQLLMMIESSTRHRGQSGANERKFEAHRLVLLGAA